VIQRRLDNYNYNYNYNSSEGGSIRTVRSSRSGQIRRRSTCHQVRDPRRAATLASVPVVKLTTPVYVQSRAASLSGLKGTASCKRVNAAAFPPGGFGGKRGVHCSAEKVV
jgi:hypothetical protein